MVIDFRELAQFDIHVAVHVPEDAEHFAKCSQGAPYFFPISIEKLAPDLKIDQKPLSGLFMLL